MQNSETNTQNPLKRTLGVFDVMCIIVGIIIGSSIYQTPGTIAGLLGSSGWIVTIWIVGGLFSFCGALCYAELASAYPKEGGDYFFLHHTYHESAGFLYAWGRMGVIHSGNIAMMAAIAGIYGKNLYTIPFLPVEGLFNSETVYALLSVIGLTAVNCLGLIQGKWTQNILSTAQVVGLTLVIVIAFTGTKASPATVAASEPVAISWYSFFLAFIFVQVTFGGWSDCAFVAAEVKQPGKNIFRSLMIGLGIVTAIYVCINCALLYAMGPQGMATSDGIMAQLMENRLGAVGGNLMAVLVVICALGSVNGMILVGGRIYHAVGRDHDMFRFLAQWNEKSSVPFVAYIIQAVIACGLLFWGTFEELVIFTSAAHWLFMLLVGISLLILRWREPQQERPYRVPFYPWVPLIYIAACIMLLYSSFDYGNSIAPYGAWIGFLIVLSGLPVYWFACAVSKRKAPTGDHA